MVALVLLCVILGVGYSFYYFDVQTYNIGSAQSNVQQNVRLAADFITKEVRYATSLEIRSSPSTPSVGYYDIYINNSNGTISYYKNGVLEPTVLNGISNGVTLALEFKQTVDNNNLLYFKVTGSSNGKNTYSIDSEVLVSNLGSDVIQDNSDVSGGLVIRYTKPAEEPPMVAVTGVALDYESLSLTAGGAAVNLVATVSPTDATNKNVIWESSNVSVAAVANGVVTPLSQGTAVITVTTVDGGFTDTCAVTVCPAIVAVTGVTLSPNVMNLNVGATGTLTADVVPANATNKNVTWSSSNNTVATVSTSGLVTAVSSGNAAITVTAVDGNFAAQCAVTVSQTFQPGDFVLYSNNVVINNGATVTGNVLIGNGTNMVSINNNSDFFGNVHVNTNLTVNNNACFGKSTLPVQLLVKGSVTFHNNVDIYGDLFYEGNLTVNNHLNVTGQKQKKTVNNPQVNLPALKSEQWYSNNGYTIVANNSWPWVNLQDNDNYFFKTSYAFDNNSGVDNIIIACAGNITFNNNFDGSGIIFAPNGTVTFNNGCDFTGFIISKAVVLNNNIKLTYQSYTNLPY